MFAVERTANIKDNPLYGKKLRMRDGVKIVGVASA